MIINMNGGGGGSNAVNFRVYTAASLPSTGKLNDICIITSTSAPSWTMNENSSPSASAALGTVSITYAASSDSSATFNALKKNALMVELVRCWQYLSDGWTSMNAYYYNGSKWVQFSTTWKATINITYPEGSTCTITNGSITSTAPNTSGSWTYTVSRAGTWTIASSDGTNSASKSVTITTEGETQSVSLAYSFACDYTGTKVFSGDAAGDWELQLKTSGTLTVTDLGACEGLVDIFLVGGGGGGGSIGSGGYTGYNDGTTSISCYYCRGSGGGGGGYTKIQKSVSLAANTQYAVTIGAGGSAGGGNGGATKIVVGSTTYTANGGNGSSNQTGGSGGSGGGGGGVDAYSGGAGGTNGGNGSAGTASGMTTLGPGSGGTGQGTTTRAFGDSSGTLYSTGGGGGGGYNAGTSGSGSQANTGGNTANTGNGGKGGGYNSGGGSPTAGGSGIVIIRNHRTA